MDAVLAAARAVHFAATMLVFGELVFVACIAGRWWRAASAAHGKALDGHVFATLASALVVAAASGFAWLMIEATHMAGAPIGEVIVDGTVGVVLRETEFGRVFMLRALLAVGLVASLAWMRAARRPDPSRAPAAIALVLAAGFLAALAAAGHAAAAGTGPLGDLHLGADAAHLLAAGAWLGALPPLVHCLRRAKASEAIAALATRFSILGIGSVLVLTASGVVNSLFLVGSFVALFGTSYGQLLDVKLALFALMLALAATNRQRLTPRLAGDDRARALLMRNARLEIGLGVVIVAIVGVLGTMVPGAHQPARWPFAFALDRAADELSIGERSLLAMSVAVAVAAIAFIIVGMRRRTPTWSIIGCLALLASLGASSSIFAVPAFPTSFATSPVPYAVDVVARGAARFARDCSSCHGAEARGDGPAASALPVMPANLAEHALHHPQGNLFWWIAHGIPDTPMPAFSPPLADVEIWEIVQFLVARASADAAMSLGPRASAQSMSRAPDFAYTVPPHAQRTLAGERKAALLVLYSTQASAARLAHLADNSRLAHAGVRVIPIPLGQRDDEATEGSAVASVYRMFAGAARGEAPQHVELLVDANGIIRARWTGIASGTDRDAQIATAVQRLPAMSGAPGSAHHGHH